MTFLNNYLPDFPCVFSLIHYGHCLEIKDVLFTIFDDTATLIILSICFNPVPRFMLYFHKQANIALLSNHPSLNVSRRGTSKGQATEALDNIICCPVPQWPGILYQLDIPSREDPTINIKQAYNFNQMAPKVHRLDAILDCVPTSNSMDQPVMFCGSYFILSTMQAGCTPIYNFFGVTRTSTNGELNPQNHLVSAECPPPLSLLLQSAGATEDLFIKRGPPSRIPTGSHCICI